VLVSFADSLAWGKSLSNNSIQDVAPLGAALTLNTSLTELKFAWFSFKLRLSHRASACSLSSNQIVDVTVLAAALAANTTVAVLEYGRDFMFYSCLNDCLLACSLSYNEIVDFSALRAAMRKNKTLKILK
jgi:hypothetical protein